jgi:hypothetical protein
MTPQKLIVFHECRRPIMSAATVTLRSESLQAESIFTELQVSFQMTHIYNLDEARIYLQAQYPDVVVLKLESYLGEKVHPLLKLRKYFGHLPILVLCEQLSREQRIEIHRIDKLFAFDLSLEKKDFAKYLLRFTNQTSKARSFVRFGRSRKLSLEFEDQKHEASFIDYSQTGAQIKMKDFRPKLKSRVLVSYLSKTTQKIREIESYVVWVNAESGRVGVQFLAVR